MSGTAARKPGFDYAAYTERRKEAMERRIAGFVGLVIKAKRCDQEPSIAYYHDGTRQLSEEDCSLLAGFLEDSLPRKNGRPRGSITYKNLAIACACCLVRIGKGVWRREHGSQRVPKAVTNSLIKRAIELVELEFPKAGGQISADAVGDKSNLKDESKTGAFVSEHLDDARRKIIELARK